LVESRLLKWADSQGNGVVGEDSEEPYKQNFEETGLEGPSAGSRVRLENRLGGEATEGHML